MRNQRAADAAALLATRAEIEQQCVQSKKEKTEALAQLQKDRAFSHELKSTLRGGPRINSQPGSVQSAQP